MRQKIRTLVQALARITARNPERLWLHYGFALAVFFGLILGAYLLNKGAAERHIAASKAIKISNEQSLLALDLVRLSQTIEGQEDVVVPQLVKNLRRFEVNHLALVPGYLSSDTLIAHYFDKDQPLHTHSRAFVAATQRVIGATPEQRAAAVRRLETLFHDSALNADLRAATTLFSDHLDREAAHFAQLKNLFLIASSVVLVTEAIFVFWPAQHNVQTTITKMRQQTNVLRASQQRLAQMNEQLEHIVHHSQLTQLPNRTSLTRYLGEAIAAQTISDAQLYLVGLDDFKAVNDMIGHDYGDDLLVAVSRSLKNCVDYDSMVAHVGGDEFVLISHEQCKSVLNRLTEATKEPFLIKGRRIAINASIGHLHIGDTDRRPLDLLADAEIALQCAKSAGGNRAQEFSPALRDDLSLLHKLQHDLRDAITNGEIEPWFQPQIRLADGKLHGAEVLARWRHPTRGLLSPDKFLPAAERAGLMVDLDHAVWCAAMRYAVAWQTSQVWRPSISLNAAPDTISDPHMVERFLFALQRSGLSADQVIVEVLETTLIDGKDDMAAINIDSLAECGIALELDDFGTGYASLSKLTQLPLSGIKLDRSLVAPLPDQGADSVVRAILALATELGLSVVAEGIEEDTQASHLSDRGCAVGQGYGFGKPMPPDEFTVWLSKQADGVVLSQPEIALVAQRT